MTLNSLSEYGFAFTNKVIGVLLTDKDYLNTIEDALNADDFENDNHKWIINKILEYHLKYHSTPSLDFIKIELNKLKAEESRKQFANETRDILKDIYSNITADDLDYVRGEFRKFCKDQAIKQAIFTSVDLVRGGDYEGIRRLFENAFKVGDESLIGHSYKEDIDSRFREDFIKKVPFKFENWNLRTDGGIPSGLTLIFGSQGGGKSWFVIDLASHLVKLGYNVLHYTLELDEDYVARRYDANMLNIPVNNIKSHREDVETFSEKLSGKLIIKSLMRKEKTVAYIESHKRLLKNNHGFEPDLIIIDYIDLLKPSKGIYKDKTEASEDLFTEIRDLGREWNIPIISPSQVNRAGARDMVVEADKMAGSYAKGMIADVSLSLSRLKRDKLDGTCRIHWMKNRHGFDGMTDKFDFNSATGVFDYVGEYLEEDEETKEFDKKPQNSVSRKEKSVLLERFHQLGL